MSTLGNKEVMAQNIRNLMNQNDVKPKDVCDTLKIPMPTFSYWINAKTYPRIDKIELLANYFGVNKSDLVEEQNVSGSADSNIKAALWGGDKDLSQEDIDALWDDVRAYAEFKTQQRKKNRWKD